MPFLAGALLTHPSRMSRPPAGDTAPQPRFSFGSLSESSGTFPEPSGSTIAGRSGPPFRMLAMSFVMRIRSPVGNHFAHVAVIPRPARPDPSVETVNHDASCAFGCQSPKRIVPGGRVGLA